MESKNMLASVALLGLALQGCSTSPRVEEHFGQAVRANLAAQVAYPAASTSTNPARGIDGQAARGAQERYERSFLQPQAADAPLIKDSGSK